MEYLIKLKTFIDDLNEINEYKSLSPSNEDDKGEFVLFISEGLHTQVMLDFKHRGFKYGIYRRVFINEVDVYKKAYKEIFRMAFLLKDEGGFLKHESGNVIRNTSFCTLLTHGLSSVFPEMAVVFKDELKYLGNDTYQFNLDEILNRRGKTIGQILDKK